jgi:hypothetical protein
VRNRNKSVLALGPIAFVLLKDMETTGVSMSFFFAGTTQASPWIA